jgi:hypothetical protein
VTDQTLDLAFFTRDRAKGCAKAVADFAKAAATWSTPPRIAVFDGSKAGGSLRDRLRETAAESGIAISYAGEDEKNEYLFRMSDALGPHAPAASFALFPEMPGVATGANCNALLLHHVGRAALLLSDDQRAGACRLGSQETVQSTDQSDPTVFWRYRTRDDALAARAVRDIDLGAAHMAAMAQAGEDGGRTRITMSGVWGDCGMSTPAYMWLCTLGNRAHVAAHYKNILDSREVIRGVEQIVVSNSRSPVVVSSGAALDLEDIAPPFVPVGRNQDALFGLCMRLVDPESRVAYLPIALRHEPRARSFTKTEMERLQGPPRIDDMIKMAIAACTAAVERRGGTIATRLEALGHALQALANDGEPAETRLRDAVRRARIGLADRLTSARDRREMPTVFRDDADRAAEAIRAGCERTWNVTDGLPGKGILQLLLRYGELVAAWPSIWQAAGAQGIPLAKPV